MRNSSIHSQVVNRKLRQDRVARCVGNLKDIWLQAAQTSGLWMEDVVIINGGPRWPRRRRLRSWISSAIKVGPSRKIAEFLKAACWLTFDPHTPVQPSDQCSDL
ncbi:unnamed protein product [Mycena citricolor]|uniref:Uncharacterized protein n=1 Tax=Mycena citricolor TaxID=2018698 RepID=A0AAD2JU43_9AGAR|nr:unnamed protein product [Mycena citricolor]